MSTAITYKIIDEVGMYDDNPLIVNGVPHMVDCPNCGGYPIRHSELNFIDWLDDELVGGDDDPWRCIDCMDICLLPSEYIVPIEMPKPKSKRGNVITIGEQ